LYDPIWQVTLRSSVMGFLLRAIHHLYFSLLIFIAVWSIKEKEPRTEGGRRLTFMPRPRQGSKVSRMDC